jgi:hypothetical protein
MREVEVEMGLLTSWVGGLLMQGREDGEGWRTTMVVAGGEEIYIYCNENIKNKGTTTGRSNEV